MIQHRKKTIRAFHGLSGSYLSGAAEPAKTAAINAVPDRDKVKMVGPPMDADEMPPDPWADRVPLGPLGAGLNLEEKEKLRREKRACAARDRRKLQREQMAAIKEKLKTPIREIKRLAEEKAKLDKETKPSSMERGKYMTDAPTGMGELVVSGGSKEMEFIASAHDRAAALGSPTSDPDSGAAFWADNDRRHVEPQGRGSDDNEDSGSFHVTLSDGAQDQKAHDYDLLLATLVQRYTVKTDAFKNPFFYCLSCGAKQPRTESVQKCIRCEARNGVDNGYVHVCRLCGTECDGFVAGKKHIDRVHGSEDRPEHDARYGDVTRKRKHPVTG